MEHLAGKKKARKERTEWGQRLRRIIFDFLPVKEFRARLIASLVWSGKAHTGHVDTLGAMQRAFAYSFGSGTNAEASASIMLDALQGASGGEPVTIDDLRWAAQLPAPEAEGQRSGRQRCAVAAQRPADRPRWGMKSETMRKARWNAEFVSRLDRVPAHACTHISALQAEAVPSAGDGAVAAPTQASGPADVEMGEGGGGGAGWPRDPRLQESALAPAPTPMTAAAEAVPSAGDGAVAAPTQACGSADVEMGEGGGGGAGWPRAVAAVWQGDDGDSEETGIEETEMNSTTLVDLTRENVAKLDGQLVLTAPGAESGAINSQQGIGSTHEAEAQEAASEASAASSRRLRALGAGRGIHQMA